MPTNKVTVANCIFTLSSWLTGLTSMGLEEKPEVNEDGLGHCGALACGVSTGWPPSCGGPLSADREQLPPVPPNVQLGPVGLRTGLWDPRSRTFDWTPEELKLQQNQTAFIQLHWSHTQNTATEIYDFHKAFIIMHKHVTNYKWTLTQTCIVFYLRLLEKSMACQNTSIYNF